MQTNMNGCQKVNIKSIKYKNILVSVYMSNNKESTVQNSTTSILRSAEQTLYLEQLNIN